CKIESQLAYESEESFWMQKSRVLWLREGDRNSKFFHACVNQRTKVNGLDNIVKADGSFCLNQGETLTEITEYFGNLFQTSNPLKEGYNFDGISILITPEMNDNLCKCLDQGRRLIETSVGLDPRWTH
ncbi:DNAse I-like superfamily protein, partial [Striga hermonthica]